MFERDRLRVPPLVVFRDVGPEVERGVERDEAAARPRRAAPAFVLLRLRAAPAPRDLLPLALALVRARLRVGLAVFVRAEAAAVVVALRRLALFALRVRPFVPREPAREAVRELAPSLRAVFVVSPPRELARRAPERGDSVSAIARSTNLLKRLCRPLVV